MAKLTDCLKYTQVGSKSALCDCFVVILERP